MSNFLRSCGGCSAHVICNDPSSQTVFAMLANLPAMIRYVRTGDEPS